MRPAQREVRAEGVEERREGGQVGQQQLEVLVRVRVRVKVRVRVRVGSIWRWWC